MAADIDHMRKPPRTRIKPVNNTLGDSLLEEIMIIKSPGSTIRKRICAASSINLGGVFCMPSMGIRAKTQACINTKLPAAG